MSQADEAPHPRPVGDAIRVGWRVWAGWFGVVAWPASLFLVASLAPFAFPEFPTQDGPSHVDTSAILNRILILHDPRFEAFFTWRANGTNCLVHVLGMPLLWVFPARMVEKIIVAGLIAGGALAVWSCARALGARNAWLCAFAAPAGYSRALFTGNFNFVLSFIFCWLILREIILSGDGVGLKRAVRLALLFMLAALAHPIGVVFAVVAGGTLVLWYAWLGRARADWLSSMVRSVATLAFAAAPALVLLGAFLANHATDQTDFSHGVNYILSPTVRLKRFLGFGQLYTVDNWQRAVCVGGAVAMLALVASTLFARAKEWRGGAAFSAADGLLLASAAALALFLIIPDGGAGAGFISGRLDFVPWLIVLIWLATRELVLPARVAAAILLGPVSVLLLAADLSAVAKLQPDLAAPRPAEAALQEGWTVLAIDTREKPMDAFPDDGQLQNEPFQHVAHIVAADQRLIMLNNWNAHYPGFPIHFRADADPYRFFNPAKLGDMDLAGYETATGHRIDAVVIVGMEPAEFAWRDETLFDTLSDVFCTTAASDATASVFVRRAHGQGCPAGAVPMMR